MRILLLHYTAGQVGGVEQVMEAHARLFAAHGHQVTVATGSEVAERPTVTYLSIPEMREVSPGDEDRLVSVLGPLCANADVCMVHNVMTMPFHPALTRALWRLADAGGRTRWIAWLHDIAACNPDYHLPAGDAALVFGKAHPRMSYVAVSEWRKRQFVELTQIEPARCRVIPNGVSPADLLALSENVGRLVEERRLFEYDLVLLQPARILRRKNIELGLRVLAELKAAGTKSLLLVTGAPDIHQRAGLDYARELERIREALGLGKEALFLHELFTVTNRDMVSLYAISDALFFPSTQEGFGLPLLEAALHRLPVFSADLQPMNALAPAHATLFDPAIAPADLARELKRVVDEPGLRARQRVTREFSWAAIYQRHLAPLLLDTATAPARWTAG